MSGAHILVVDDDPDLREVVSLALEMVGHRVTEAANGLLALLALERELPQLILLDMKMPVMDGWAFAREFHARYDRRIPVVVITASEDARLRARDVGADAFLGKPFEMDALLELAERLVAPERGHTGVSPS